jgi:hypothetical protein
MPDPSQSFIVTQLPAEPRSSGGGWTSRGGDLPEEVLTSAVGRVRIAAVISGTLWLLALVNVWLAPNWPKWVHGTAGWPDPNRIYASIGVLGSLGLAWGIRWFRARPRTVLDLGLGLEVFTAALICLTTHNEFEFNAGGISWVTAVILVDPAIAPAAPRRILIAGLLAASMDGLGVGLAALRGPLPEATGPQLVGGLAWMLVPNYLCAILALVPATLIRRLGHAAGVARELGIYRLGLLIER